MKRVNLLLIKVGSAWSFSRTLYIFLEVIVEFPLAWAVLFVPEPRVHPDPAWGASFILLI